MPLSAFVEPFTLSPPQIDETRLRSLHDFHQDHSNLEDRLLTTIYGLLPPQTHIYNHQLQLHIRNTRQLRNLIRAVFRLNSNSVQVQEDADLQKTRIAHAFQTLRALNELTSTALVQLDQQRTEHATRNSTTTTTSSMEFYVGQVVQHKHERWRGVICGWEQPVETPNQMELSSLTTKIYTAKDFLTQMRYEVILDLADMHTLQATSPLIVATQQDLELVDDPQLCRIRSHMVAQHFRGYQRHARSFQPDELLAYEYPVDWEVVQQQPQTTDKTFHVAVEAAAQETVTHCQDLMAYLEDIVTTEALLPTDHQKEEEQYSVLRAFQERLSSRSELVQDPSVVVVGGDDDTDRLQSATAHLRYIYTIMAELRDLLWHRQTLQQKQSLEKSNTIQFAVGDVVYHQFFGFRGIVVACDTVPKANVKHWDGVRHIEHPEQKPFYHVLPDEHDCHQVFGGPRGMRYVCQDNLVACRSDRTNLTVTLEENWSRQLEDNGRTTVFRPSTRALFKHGSDIGDDGLTETVLKRIQDELREWQVASRSNTGSVPEPPAANKSAAAFRLPLSALFLMLDAVTTQDGAEAIELMIKDTFKVHPDGNLHFQLEKGLSEMIRGNHQDALEIFESLTEQDSEYAEAWNWVATCEYLIGSHQSALKAAVKALELQPFNFQTQSGMGLCFFEMGRYEEAAAAFRQCLDLNPWSPVSTKLSACIDILKRRGSEDSKNSEESDKE
ncbi:Tetratricopeptide repeat [Seminavis robusta]|uniref:Tetratricopeptide repeat n=1 Tax=Seminavis robusta TaxID=568900 RepID=A0A9N8HHW2_9STRA|nr:Tetratricopeptide repeat [Seminavis robusta]|eukprot:Sro587_g171250.1 Tetratricopeptide repeat (725) ;mRNA; r:1673-4025